MGDAASGEKSESTGEFTLEAVLAVFRTRADPARPLTANDVMDALGCSRRTAHNKLNDLVEAGDLETRKVGARGRVWWMPFDAIVEEPAPTREPSREPAVETEIERADLPGSGRR
ncbi:ArsR family transcriptional regulator [Haloarculaceae archaeon H-GB11]|nr:ArsR family transcriptional regulator [Haloarculaceae archaeon H-GB11]